MNDDVLATSELPIPTLRDMQAMLRIACRLYELPSGKRAEHLLDGMRDLIHAAGVRAWRLDGSGPGSATGGIALPGRTVRSSADAASPRPEDDPAASLLARSARKRTPVVRFRDELIDPQTWRQAVRKSLPATFHDGLYSLHHDALHHHPPARSLLAFYRPRGMPWGERERGIVHLLHAQGGWVLGE